MSKLKRTVSVLLAIIFIGSCFAVLSTVSMAAKQYSLGEKGLTLIKYYEGYRAYPYKDYGHWSIGYGSVCEDPSLYPNGITEAEASALLVTRMASYEAKLDSFLDEYNIKVNQNQYDALVSFTYNLGNPWKRYDEFDLKTILINGAEKYCAEDIKNAFGQFCKAGGKVLSGLVKRRAAEAELFMTPVVVDKPVCSLFDDVRDNAWYFPAVKFASERGLLNGTGNNCFSPSLPLTRAMAATVIAKLASADLSVYTESPFADVPAGKWYTPAISWAYESSIVSGVGYGCYGPGNAVTRQDFMVILYGYAVKSGLTQAQSGAPLVGFADVAEVSSYATDALVWATRAGLLGGDSEGCIDPKGTATRAQTAQILMKFVELYG